MELILNNLNVDASEKLDRDESKNLLVHQTINLSGTVGGNLLEISIKVASSDNILKTTDLDITKPLKLTITQ